METPEPRLKSRCSPAIDKTPSRYHCPLRLKAAALEGWIPAWNTCWYSSASTKSLTLLDDFASRWSEFGIVRFLFESRTRHAGTATASPTATTGRAVFDDCSDGEVLHAKIRMTSEVLSEYSIVTIGIATGQQVSSRQVRCHYFEVSPPCRSRCGAPTSVPSSATTPTAHFPGRDGISLQRFGSIWRHGRIEAEEAGSRTRVHTELQNAAVSTG